MSLQPGISLCLKSCLVSLASCKPTKNSPCSKVGMFNPAAFSACPSLYQDLDSVQLELLIMTAAGYEHHLWPHARLLKLI